MLFNDREYALMGVLQNGGEIPKRDQRIAFRLASLGIIRLGFYNEEKFCETGHLSDMGSKMLRREQRVRSPILRFLYAISGPLF